jgi:hypothetical protein
MPQPLQEMAQCGLNQPMISNAIAIKALLDFDFKRARF